MMTDELNRAIYMRDKRERQTPEPRAWVWGRDYGKDLLADLNQLAHTRGTDCVMRDCLQRAYSELARLREELNDAQADALRMHGEKMRYFNALLEMRCRDDKNGSLHQNYRDIIDVALADEQKAEQQK